MAGENSAYLTLEQNVVNSCDEESIIKTLKTILLDANNVNLSNVTVLNKLLNLKNNEIIKLTCQGIAETAKTNERRQQLTNADLINLLISLLDINDAGCLTQICRALGNLCYENDKARQLVAAANGFKKLLEKIETNITSQNAQFPLSISCGFLLNYLMSNENAQKNALNLNVLKVIEQIFSVCIENFSETEDIFTHALLILNLLTENMIDEWFSDQLVLDLVKILEMSMNPEISELCLELLHNQAENDSIKLTLAKAGTCELLYNLLEKHKSLVQDEEGRALMKLACDLIVLILTGDESMSLLYDEGNGIVYKNMLNWLHSDDIDLLITGVLAVGNFARNDAHCIQMVKIGLCETLLEILSKHNKADGEIRLQHALLSALRNLVIPMENKAPILNSGLVAVIYPLLDTEHQPVVFKLLGTLRMVIDGQNETAVQLGVKSHLLEKLVDCCLNSDHPGVRAESPRLLAWLVKHSRNSPAVTQTLVQTDSCIRILVEMISAPHTVMQNEALLALNLLALAPNTNAMYGALHEADVGKHVAFLLNKYGEKMEPELMENLVAFLELTAGRKPPQYDENVVQELEKCLHRDAFHHLADRIKKIIHLIDSG